MSRPYPAEWDNEPEDSDDFPAFDEAADEAALARLETPDGRDVDDIWHAQRAEDRDRFLHPIDPWE